MFEKQSRRTVAVCCPVPPSTAAICHLPWLKLSPPAEQDEVHVEVVQLRAVRILAAATRLVTATEVRTAALFALRGSVFG